MTTSTHPADESKDGGRIDTSRAAMRQALEALELGRDYVEGERLENERRYKGHEHLAPDDAYAVGQIDNAIAALRAALAEQKCSCGDRPADHCPGEWEPGCDLGANEKHAKVATADASLGAAIEAIDAALAEQAQPTSEAGWLHRLDVEKSEAWVAGYAQGQKRAAEQAQPVADAARVIEWATSTPRKAAAHAFTEGPERQAAYWIEWAEARVVSRRLTTEQAQPVAVVTECEACFTPDVCRLRGTCDHYAAEKLRITAPPAPVAPQPLTIERLRAALVAARIIPPAAVEDPDGYDDGVTLHRIEALHRRIA